MWLIYVTIACMTAEEDKLVVSLQVTKGDQVISAVAVPELDADQVREVGLQLQAATNESAADAHYHPQSAEAAHKLGYFLADALRNVPSWVNFFPTLSWTYT